MLQKWGWSKELALHQLLFQLRAEGTSVFMKASITFHVRPSDFWMAIPPYESVELRSPGLREWSSKNDFRNFTFWPLKGISLVRRSTQEFNSIYIRDTSFSWVKRGKRPYFDTMPTLLKQGRIEKGTFYMRFSVEPRCFA